MKQVDLGKTNIKKLFWMYVIPSIFSIIFSTTAQFIDSAFIGRYIGGNALAALTILFPFIMVINAVSIMIAIGGVTYAGIYRGREEIKRSDNFFNLTLLLTFIAGILSTLVFLLLNQNIGLFVDIDPETLGYVQTYGTIISLTFVFQMYNMMGTLFLNLDKKPTLAVAVTSISTVTNVILNYVFIVRMNLGIAGAAYASGISQLVPTIVFLYVFIKKTSFTFFFPKIDFGDIRNIFLNGSSELISISSVSIANFILNKVILTQIGVVGVSGLAIATQLSGLTISLGFGVSDAIQSIVSYNYGAELYNRIKKTLRMAIQLNVVFGLLLFLSVNLFGRELTMFFIREEEVIKISVEILSYYGFAFIVMGSNIVISTYYTSVDSPLISGAITILRSLIYLAIGLIVFPYFFGEIGIWLSLLFAEFATIITAFFIYKAMPYGKQKKYTKEIYTT